MKRLLTIAAAALAAATSTVAAAGGAGPHVSLSATPTHLVLPGRAMSTITVANTGDRALAVSVDIDDYAVGTDGRVRLDPAVAPARAAGAWLTVSPRRLQIPAGGTASVRVASAPPANATPGDHHALVLLTTTNDDGQLAIRTRLGVIILARVPGTLRSDLRVTGVRTVYGAAGRTLHVTVANAGNVAEQLDPGRVRVYLRHGLRTVTSLVLPGRTLMPGASADLSVLYRGTLRGRLSAIVRIQPSAQPGVRRADATSDKAYPVNL